MLLEWNNDVLVYVGAMGRVVEPLVRLDLVLLIYGVLGVVEDKSDTSDSMYIDYDDESTNAISLRLVLRMPWVRMTAVY